MTAITSAASFATQVDEIMALSVTDAATARTVFTVGKAAVYEGRNLAGLSPTDAASVEFNAQKLEDWLNRSVQPSITSPA
jgi:hypothetical protein